MKIKEEIATILIIILLCVEGCTLVHMGYSVLTLEWLICFGCSVIVLFLGLLMNIKNDEDRKL